MIIQALFVGVVATAVMDLMALVQRRYFGIQGLDYAMVGRWIGHLPKGRYVHHPIGTSAAIKHERLVGWLAHYLIGIAFASVLLWVAGPTWAAYPTPIQPLLFGVASVAAPFLVLQPGMGAGLAARKTPKPNIARMKSLIAHLSFGVGLWFGAVLWVST